MASLQFFELKFILGYLFLLQFLNELLRLLLFLKADDLSLKVRVLLNEDVDVGRDLLNFILEILSKNRNLSLQVSQAIDSVILLLVQSFQGLSGVGEVLLSPGTHISSSVRCFDLVQILRE